MRHRDRRKELGKMLMDISKYLVTVGLVGGIIADKLYSVLGIIMFVLAVVSAIIGFYIIPEIKEDK